MKSITHSIVFAALTLGAFCAPSSVLANREHPIIGLTIDSFDTPRWQKDRDVIVNTVTKLGGVVVVRNAQSKDEVQIANFKEFLTMKVDAIVVVAHSGEALSGVIKDANTAGVPVICYDRLLRDTDVACYIGFDTERVGELQASYVVEHLPAGQTLKIVRICGSLTDPNALLNKKGQDKVLAPLVAAGRVQIVLDDWAKNWSPEAGRALMTAAWDKGGATADAVLAANDNLAGAVLEVFNEKGVAKLPLITGQDADRSACLRIKEGTQAMTVYKSLDKLAVLAGEVVMKIAKGEVIPATSQTNNGLKEVPTVLGPMLAVDKANLDATVIADGFLKR